MAEKNLEDLLLIQRLAREGQLAREAHQPKTRVERNTRAGQLRALIDEKEREVAELKKEYRLYHGTYNRREEVDWEDNDNRVTALEKLIADIEIKRKDIALYLGITPTYLSRVLRAKRQPLSHQLEKDIRQAIVDLDTERRIRMNKARADQLKKRES